MVFWLVQRLTRGLRGLRLYALLLAASFFAAWGLMAAFEPADSAIDHPRNYWWWFVVTVFTVGYGDLFPVSTGGRIAAFLVMFTAIGVVAALVGDLLNRASARKSKRMKGLIQVKTQDHFAVVGYAPSRTERLVKELCATPHHQVVICAPMDQVAEHPMPDEPRVSLVGGDPTDPAVMDRVSLGTARAAIVDTPDGNDDTAALTALLIGRTNPNLHVVVAARDLDRTMRLLGQFGVNYECAQWHDVRLLSEAAQDPGITRFYAELKTSGTGSDTHSLRLPEAVRGRVLGDLLFPLKEELNVTVCALGIEGRFITNPPLSTPLEAGTTLYYIGDRRLAWKDVQTVMSRPATAVTATDRGQTRP